LSIASSQPIDPLELYAGAIDTSDYVAAVAPLVRRGLSGVGDLLDVGAGGGQLGHALHDAARRWTAIEPSPTMQARLARLEPPPEVVPRGWKEARVPSAGHDTVLAATMPAFLHEPEAFLGQCRAWARRTVVWVVPAHAGPRGLCFAGCLPTAWHGEDETPGIEVVLAGLPPALRPPQIAFADWTFSAVVRDLPALAIYLADRLGWPATDGRRAEMRVHLAAQARRDGAGLRLEIFRKSAVCIWGRA
jgi:SAM-dependent methyltransferase